jgi:hypothetical protein
MNRSKTSNSQLSLTPLGAGDLIDRSVRFYRKNFWTFILISSPPIVVGAVFLIGWMLIGRSLFIVSVANPVETSLYQLFISFGNFFIWFIQLIAIFVVMGGASRNFVRHILFGEPITFRETYKNVKSRIGGLTGISTLLVILMGLFGLIIFYIALIVAFIAVALTAYIFQFAGILVFIVSLALTIATVFGALWLFFLVVSRFVYVPQVMLVEGQGAFSAIGRSAGLAGKNIKRVAALFIFTIVATYSALSLFYVPLGWYAWVNGIDFFAFDAVDQLPAWYEISAQVITEISLILLTPILMIGLCLLYVDERVQSEGYDVELMAAGRLGDIPALPQRYANPLQPALSGQMSPEMNERFNEVPKQAGPKVKKSSNSMLGLDQ